MLCGYPGCARPAICQTASPAEARCYTHFWVPAPVPEPPEDARAVERWMEPE